MIRLIWDEVKELEGMVEIYLYGSVALGDDEKSDIDILILGKIERENLLT